MPPWPSTARALTGRRTLQNFRFVREPGILPDRFEPTPHAAGGIGTVDRANDHAHEHRQREQRADGNHRGRRGFLRRSAEFAREEQADAAADGSLRDREEAGLDG